MSMGIVFRVEVCNSHERGFETAVSLELPAGSHEILDAFDRARIKEGEVIETELLETELDFLYERLPGNPDLLDLNQLARRLAAMEDWQLTAMEGLCEMADRRNMGQPIPVAELVNMADSLENCQIAYDVYSDEELGKFYAENGMLPETEGLPEQVRSIIDYRALGEKRRLAEGGVFTRAGYVVLGDERSQDYVGGQQPWPEQPDALITATLYTISGIGAEGRAPGVKLNFPVPEQAVAYYLEQIGADSLSQCGLRVEDCAAPQMELAIERYFRKNKSLDKINEFAAALDLAEGRGQLLKFKAMLEAAGCTALPAANILAAEIYQCEFNSEITSPYVYAAQKMAERFPGINKTHLAQAVSLDALGRLLMQTENVYHTDYGAIRRTDGQPLMVKSQAPAPAPEYDLPEPGQAAGPVMEM